MGGFEPPVKITAVFQESPTRREFERQEGDPPRNCISVAGWVGTPFDLELRDVQSRSHALSRYIWARHSNWNGHFRMHCDRPTATRAKDANEIIIGYNVSLRSKVQALASFRAASSVSPCGDGRAHLPSGRSTALIARFSIKNPMAALKSGWLNRSSLAMAGSERQSSSDLPLFFSRLNACNNFKPSLSREARAVFKGNIRATLLV
jgi:hypothetical protein